MFIFPEWYHLFAFIAVTLTPSREIPLPIAQATSIHLNIQEKYLAISNGTVPIFMFNSFSVSGTIDITNITKNHHIVQCHMILWCTHYGNNNYNSRIILFLFVFAA